ncbi:MAG: hypothetical protein U0169_07875 [Polyangiaceae bacterium]
MSRRFARSRKCGTVAAAMFATVGAMAGCGGPAANAPVAAREPFATHYVVDVDPKAPSKLHVVASFAGLKDVLVEADENASLHVKNARVSPGLDVENDEGRPIRFESNQAEVTECRIGCTIRYDIDLRAVLETCPRALDCVVGADDVVLSPAVVWLIRPHVFAGTKVKVTFRKGREFVFTGLGESTATFEHEFPPWGFPDGSPTSFGPIRRVSARSGASRLEAAVMPGPLALSDADLTSWLEDTSTLVGGLYGKYPVPRLTTFFLPVPNQSEVVFGKVLSLAGPTAVILVGGDMQKKDLHDDWVLVHEMIHLGFPSLDDDEGRWLSEGLATYYEPVLRTRAGWMTEDLLWQGFARQMKRALPRPRDGETKRYGRNDPGLASRHDIDATYWGGALFCLLADVRLRERTRGEHSLDTVVRAIVAKGGDTRAVWSLAEVFRFADATTHTQVFSELRHELVDAWTFTSFKEIWGKLGIDETPARTRLKDDAPLASLRRSIGRGDVPGTR